MRDSPRLGCQFASYPEEVQLRVWGGRGRCGKIAIEKGKSRPRRRRCSVLSSSNRLLVEAEEQWHKSPVKTNIANVEMHDLPLTFDNDMSQILKKRASAIWLMRHLQVGQFASVQAKKSPENHTPYERGKMLPILLEVAQGSVLRSR